MKSLNNISALLIMAISSVLINPATAQVKTKIVGEILNNTGYSDQVKIIRIGDDIMQSELLGVAKINEDNSFEITIVTPVEEVCQLVVQVDAGEWKHRIFCTYSGVVEILMDCNSFSGSTVSGGLENQRLMDAKKHHYELVERYIISLQNSMKKLEENRTGIYSQQGQEFVTKMENPQITPQERKELMVEYREMTNARTFHSTEFYALEDSIKSALPLIMVQMAEYDKAHPSLSRFGELIYNLGTFETFKEENNMLDNPLELIRASFTALSDAYPNHPYVVQGDKLISTLTTTQAKGYVDFAAPDLDGNMVRLSDQIQGKVAVLDMWASWCGPCIAKSVSYMPVYEKYKGKGFVVIGVAREYKNTEAMRGVIQRNGYPWMNLVELDNQNGLWRMYGIGNAAGGVFVIDRSGKIVAKNPTAQELEQLLVGFFAE